MKKLFVLFSFLAISSLLFVSCQSSENITAPNTDLDKPGPITWGTFPLGITDYDVPLVAGQDYANPVGYVHVAFDGNALTLQYNLNNSGEKLTEIHVDLATTQSIWSSSNTGGLHVNSQGNPKIGNFDFSDTDPDGLTLPYTVTFDGSSNPTLAEALGGSVPATGTTILIGAHGVWEGNCEGDPTTATLCPDWGPDNMTPVFHSIGDTPGYIISATFAYLPGTWYGWCVDNTREISSGNARNVDFICSYDGVPQCTTFVEYPDRLDRVNWLINNLDPAWGKKTIQAAIWKIINPDGTETDWQGSTINSGEWPHDPVLRDQIVDMAMTNGAGFVPSCGDKVLILVYATGPDGTREPCDPGLNRQVVAIERTIECQTNCDSETVWAIPLLNGLPNEDQSNLYPGHIWFRYFGFTL